MTTLCYDTETTGLLQWSLPSEDPSQPHMVEFGGILDCPEGKAQGLMNFLIKPEGWVIPDEAAAIHGVTQERAMKYGIPIKMAIDLIWEYMELAEEGFYGHNISFDARILRVAAIRAGREDFKKYLETKPRFCTMLTSTDICRVPKATGRGFKWPTLTEATKFYFNEELKDAHTALADAKACRRIFNELRSRGKVVFKIPELKEAA